MKIAFIGTHGAGKTTFAAKTTAYLREKGVAAEMVVEVARRCPFPRNESTTYEAQMWILGRQLQEEIEAGRSAEVVVCDRSVLDNWAYWIRALGDRVFPDGSRQFRTQERLDAIHNFVTGWRGWLATYDLFFYCPLLSAPGDDPARSSDPAFQREADEIVQWMTAMYGRGRVVDLPEAAECRWEDVVQRLNQTGLLGRNH